MEFRQRNSVLISSRANSHVKWFRALKERRGREASGAFLVEGPRAIQHALSVGATPLRVACGPQLREGNEPILSVVRSLPPDVEILRLDANAFEAISDTVTSQGVLAAFPIRNWAPEHPFSPDALVLVLDRVSDPGNLGTLLRSAAAVGCDGALLSPGCADAYNPKVVRSSAGAIFSVDFATVDWNSIQWTLQNLAAKYAADGRAQLAYYEADLKGGCAILIGNEAGGLGSEARALASSEVRIPMMGGVESLNAGVAGSLLMFEALRQRAQRRHGAGDGTGR